VTKRLTPIQALELKEKVGAPMLAPRLKRRRGRSGEASALSSRAREIIDRARKARGAKP
jgi:hypothetical protein